MNVNGPSSVSVFMCGPKRGVQPKTNHTYQKQVEYSHSGLWQHRSGTYMTCKVSKSCDYGCWELVGSNGISSFSYSH